MDLTIINPKQTTFDVVEAGSVFYSKLPTVKHNSGYFMKTSTNQYNYNAVDVRTGATAYFNMYELVLPVNAEVVIKQ